MNTGLSSEILFEKFEIIEVLKKDEHAAVFLANHIYLSKRIILKVLNTQKISDQSLVERFKREAKILARLDHLHIIKVLDFGTFKEFFYISFEYIDGLSLRNLLKQKQLTFDQKKQLMIQLLKGLHHAHLNNIIHRDIKPENIFVDNSLNLKIGDFGLALSAEDNMVTNPYSIVGTPSYMSPEQVRGAKLTPQSDLFSAGVVLVELFTGKNPFLKENISLTLNEIMAYDENVILKFTTDLPQDIKDILFHLLRKNSKDRYSSALEVLNELNVEMDQPTIVIKNGEMKSQRNYSKVVGTAFFVIVLVLIIVFIQQTSSNQSNLPFQNNSQATDSNKVDDNGKRIEPNSPVTKNNDSLMSDKVNTDSQSLNNPLVQQNANNIPATDRTVGVGSLKIFCNQTAKLYINGEEIDELPIRSPLTLTEGEYSVKIHNQDYPPFTTLVSIKKDSVNTLRVDLNKTVGFIRCSVVPYANVVADNKNRGEIDERPKVFIVTPNKSISVTARNPYHFPLDTIVTVAKGDTLKLNLKLKKR